MQFDCTRCEELLLDFAYGELDEVTAAAFRRHADTCARCGAALADVRTVREAFSMLPLESPSPTIDDRILAAVDKHFAAADDAKRATQRLESRSILDKLFDVFRVAALRPQYAMVMLLVLVVGIGLWFAPSMRMSDQGPGMAPSLVGTRGPEFEPAPPPPASTAEPEIPATTSVTAQADTPALEADREQQLAEGTVAQGRGEPTSTDDLRSADGARQGVEGGEDGRLARADRQASDQSAHRIITATPSPEPAPADRLAVTRGLRGGGGGGGDAELDEDTAGQLGFGQRNRDAEARSSAAPARRPAVLTGPSNAAPEEAARSERSWAVAPGPVMPSPPPAQAPMIVPGSPAAPRASLEQQQQRGAGGSVASTGSAGNAGAQDAYGRGMTAYRAGQWRAAIPELQTAVARPGLSSDAMATAYYAIARSYDQSGNLLEAAHRYVDLMARFPAYRSNADVNWLAAEAYRRLGDNARAEQYYRVAERSGTYAERVRARRVQINAPRRAAPAYDAMEAAEPDSPSPAAAH